MYTLKRNGESTDKIAGILCVHRSVLYRELKRNAGLNGYNYEEAQEKAFKRKKSSVCNNLKMNDLLISVIEAKLKLQWSPEQISGWLKRQNEIENVSHETIYQHVWQDKLNGGNLHKELRHKGKKYNRRGSGKAGRGCIPGRIDITERPAIVDEKSRT